MLLFRGFEGSIVLHPLELRARQLP